MPTVEFPQHERLTRILNIYRNAMRRHIAKKWREGYGDSWFEHLKDRLPENNLRELEASERALDFNRMDDGHQRTDEDVWQELLDIPLFLVAVKDEKVMSNELASQENTQAIYDIYQIRNLWAHPPVKDLPRRLVDQAVRNCLDVLAVVDEEAQKAAFSEIDGSQAQPVGVDGDEIADKIANRLQASEDRRTETVAGLSNAIVSLQARVEGLEQALQEVGEQVRAQDRAVDAAVRRMRSDSEQSRNAVNQLRKETRDLIAEVKQTEDRFSQFAFDFMEQSP